MKDVAREFLARLSAEEDKLIAKMQLDETGAGLITAIKEFDHYYYNLVRHERSEETDHHFHIMQLGLPRLIAGILVTIPRFRYPVITFKSDHLLIQGALEMVSALGVISFLSVVGPLAASFASLPRTARQKKARKAWCACTATAASTGLLTFGARKGRLRAGSDRF